MWSINILKQKFLDLVFPDGIECVICDSLIDNSDKYICSKCYSKIKFICGKSCDGCGKQLPNLFDSNYCSSCLSREINYSGIISCIEYNEFARTIIAKFKYNHRRYIGRMIGFYMSELLMSSYIDDIDIIVPVPIYKLKHRRKGYNHTQIISEQIANICNKTSYDNLLIRSKKTKPLKELNKIERQEEVKSAFEFNSKYKDLIKTKNVLLVDDIFTTGATVSECSRVLLENGCRSVFIISFATGKL